MRVGIFFEFFEAFLVWDILIDDHGFHGTIVTDDADDFTGIDTGNPCRMVLFHLFTKGFGVTEVRWGIVIFPDDEAGLEDAFGFIVLISKAIVSDERIGHDDDLIAIAWIGEDLLIADHRCVEDDFGDLLVLASKTFAMEDAVIF